MNLGKLGFVKVGLACLVLALVACGGGGGGGGSGSGQVATQPTSPPPPPPPPPVPLVPPQSVEREIAPNVADPSLTTELSPHFVINPGPSVTQKRLLFVMLPGTAATPRTYREIVRVGPTRGYHALGLSYPNDQSEQSLCGSSLDPDCSGNLRREIILGENTSLLVNVTRANSINGRLRSLLTYLNATFPNEGWEQFLFSGEVNWSRVVIAGHSQGAGHAAYTGKLFSLERIVMFSGPADSGVPPNSTATWLSLPNFTPTSRFYGFIHTADPLNTLAAVTPNWSALGLGAFGPITSVDGASPPFGNSHQLSTSAPPNPNPIGPTASPPHGAPVVDAVTPRNANGTPVYAPVWIYLAFP